MFWRFERGREGLSLHAIPQPSLSGRAAAVSKGPREAPSLAFPYRRMPSPSPP